MIFQTLNYIAASKVSDAEAELLVYELLSTIIMWNCDWNPEDIDMKSIINQVNETCSILLGMILRNLNKTVQEHGWRETC